MALNKIRHLIANAVAPSPSKTGPRPDDVYLVSYPRSGNTWVRTMIAYQLYPDNAVQSLKDLDTLVPDLHRGVPPDGRSLQSEKSDRLVIKSHHPRPFHRSKSDLGDRKVIYLVRHPFDVVVSFYDYKRGMKNSAVLGNNFSDFVKFFLDGAVWPCSWSEHVTSWVGTLKAKQLLLLRYEDLKEDPTREIQRIASFLGLSLSLQEAQAVGEKSSRERMIDLEKKGSLVDPDYHFVRRSSEDRSANLTDALQDRISNTAERALEMAGYPV